MPTHGRKQMISSSAPQGVVSDEFATGNGLTSLNAPIMSSLFPAGAKPASTGEVILWGYVSDPMMLLRRGRVIQAMVATLKRPPPAGRLGCKGWSADGRHWSVSEGAVSDEFAFDKVGNRKWTCLINRPDDPVSKPKI